MSIQIVNTLILCFGLLALPSCKGKGVTVCATVSKDGLRSTSELWCENGPDGSYIMELSFYNHKTKESRVLYSKPIVVKTIDEK